MGRIENIIEILLEQKEYIVVDKLAKKLLVSEKTIRNSLIKVEEQLKNFNLVLDKKPGSGIIIYGEDEDKFRLIDSLNKHKTTELFSPQYRFEYILKKLLLHNEELKINKLVQEFFVSRGTVYKDILSVEKWLRDFNLTLIKSNYHNLILSGEEGDIRNAVISFLNSKYDTIKHTIEERTEETSRISDKLLSKLMEIMILNYYDLEKILTEAEEKLNNKFSDEAFQNLLLHIAIAIKRKNITYEDNFINEEILSLKDSREFEIASEIIEKIHLQLGIILPEYEKYYITIHLRGAKNYYESNDEVEEKIDFTSKSLEVIIANEIADYVENVTGIKIKKDPAFLSGLILHLNPIINRIKYGLTLKNPLINEIEEKYPQAYGLAWLCNSIFKKYLSKRISREEIGYIAIHIAAALERNKKPFKVIVVCASGIGTAQLLSIKIEKYFKDIEIAEITYSKKLKNINLDEIDFIISTVETSTYKPTIIVNPLLNENDIKKIEKVMQKLSTTKNESSPKGYFEEDLLLLEESFKTKEQLIKHISDKLIGKGYVTEGFYEKLLDREEKSSTEIGRGIAIPHAPFNYVMKSKICIVKLTDSILWKTEFVDFVMFICCQEKDIGNLSKFLKAFYKFIDEEHQVNKLKAITEPLNLIKLLEDLIC